MKLLINQIVHLDPLHIALAEIERLALRRQNAPILEQIIQEETAHQNRPDLINPTRHHLDRLTK